MMRHTITMVVNQTEDLLAKWRYQRAYPSAAAVCEQTETLMALVLDLVEENQTLQDQRLVTIERGDDNNEPTHASTIENGRNTGQYL